MRSQPNVTTVCMAHCAL